MALFRLKITALAATATLLPSKHLYLANIKQEPGVIIDRHSHLSTCIHNRDLL